MLWGTITITIHGTTWSGVEACALLAGIGLAVIVVVAALCAVVVTVAKRRE